MKLQREQVRRPRSWIFKTEHSIGAQPQCFVVLTYLSVSRDPVFRQPVLYQWSVLFCPVLVELIMAHTILPLKEHAHFHAAFPRIRCYVVCHNAENFANTNGMT